MKTISDYSIHCTEAQTKKALELGAPIEESPMIDIIRNEIGKHCLLHGSNVCWFPTAEQMIGFITEKNPTLILQLADLTKSLGYKQGCLTFIDNYLK